MGLGPPMCTRCRMAMYFFHKELPVSWMCPKCGNSDEWEYHKGLFELSAQEEIEYKQNTIDFWLYPVPKV